MAGRPPDELARQFAADTFTLTIHELAGKYGIAESTVRDWRLFCKHYLELAVNYGVSAITFVNRKDGPGPVADEGKRYEALFGDSEVALTTDIAAVEIWLALVECDRFPGLPSRTGCISVPAGLFSCFCQYSPVNVPLAWRLPN